MEHGFVFGFKINNSKIDINKYEIRLLISGQIAPKLDRSQSDRSNTKLDSLHNRSDFAPCYKFIV